MNTKKCFERILLECVTSAFFSLQNNIRRYFTDILILYIIYMELYRSKLYNFWGDKMSACEPFRNIYIMYMLH